MHAFIFTFCYLCVFDFLHSSFLVNYYPASSYPAVIKILQEEKSGVINRMACPFRQPVGHPTHNASTKTVAQPTILTQQQRLPLPLPITTGINHRSLARPLRVRSLRTSVSRRRRRRSGRRHWCTLMRTRVMRLIATTRRGGGRSRGITANTSRTFESSFGW